MQLLLETMLLVLCAAIAAVGYGSGLSSILRIRPNLGDRGILGLFIFGFLACLLHFFTPVSQTVQFGVLAFGIGIALASRKELRNSAAVWAGVFILSVYVLSHRQSDLRYDGGLYYLQTMRWIREYPIVPGLGSLHGRLAFNSILFPIAGIADRSGLGWISNALVILFVLLSLAIRLRNVISEGRGRGIEFWAIVLSILFLLSENHYISGWYGVLNADSFAAVLLIYWTCLALGLSGAQHVLTDLALLLLSAVLAVAIKVSSAPLLLPTFALVWIHRKGLAAPIAWRTAAAGSSVLALWMVRGVVLSGCAIYPASQTCISALPWAEPEYLVKAESLSIRAWARQAGEYDFAKVVKDRAWVAGWLNAARQDHSLRLLLVFAPLGLIAAILRRKGLGAHAPDLLSVAIGLIAGLIFWFLSAPDPRFGQGFILAAALLGGSVALAACFGQPRSAKPLPSLLLAFMVLVSVRGLWRGKSDFVYENSDVLTYQFSANGNRVFVPKTGDQCWDHSLPCTPYLDVNALRKVRWPADLPMHPSNWIPDELPQDFPKGVQDSAKVRR